MSAVLAEGRKCRGRAARADAELEPPARQGVEHRSILGHAQRLLHGQRHDAGAEADARRAGRHVAQEHEGRGQAALVAVEMMLRHPGRVEAVTLGVDDLVRPEAEARAWAAAMRRYSFRTSATYGSFASAESSDETTPTARLASLT